MKLEFSIFDPLYFKNFLPSIAKSFVLVLPKQNKYIGQMQINRIYLQHLTEINIKLLIPNGDWASVVFPPLKRKFFELEVESSKAEPYPKEFANCKLLPLPSLSLLFKIYVEKSTWFGRKPKKK